MSTAANTIIAVRASLRSPTHVFSGLTIRILVCLLILYIYLHDIGENPYGFFCDEAEIGLQSYKFASTYSTIKQNFLFYNHFGPPSGALPLYTTAPFVLLFGLSEFAIRLPSAVFMLVSFVLLYYIFKKLGLIHAETVVLLFALTPIVIHMSRINFGHSPSIFCIVLGFLLYVKSKEKYEVYLIEADLNAIYQLKHSDFGRVFLSCILSKLSFGII